MPSTDSKVRFGVCTDSALREKGTRPGQKSKPSFGWHLKPAPIATNSALERPCHIPSEHSTLNSSPVCYLLLTIPKRSRGLVGSSLNFTESLENLAFKPPPPKLRA